MQAPPSKSSDDFAGALSDVPPPSGTATAESLAARLSPMAFIANFSPDDWEEFTRELVVELKGQYVLVKRFGGTGDRGKGLAAFKTDRGLEGSWDCYQCKHYAKPLTPTDAWPEILKLLTAVDDGHCRTPDAYWFIAPCGAGNKLDTLLSQPTKLKREFLAWMQEKHPAKVGEGSSLKAVIEVTDFAMFEAKQPAQIIAMHAASPQHEVRFGLPLKPRDPAPSPPTELHAAEARYVTQLIAAYQERHPDASFERATLSAHQLVGEHFDRQRVTFYKAESLRVYSRDSVPDGTFEALQDDVRSGVIEVADREYPNGYERLQAVLAATSALSLHHHRLVQRADFDDRKGICHQLANDGRLTWVETE